MTPWTAACQASLSITNSQSLLKLVSIKSMMPSNHLILCHPLLLLPSIFPNIKVFSNDSVLHIRWLKYWSFSFSISPSDECLGLISFRIGWLDLPAVQGTLKSLLQSHSSKASIFSWLFFSFKNYFVVKYMCVCVYTAWHIHEIFYFNYVTKYNWMELSIFAMLCNHHSCSFPKTFHHPR